MKGVGNRGAGCGEGRQRAIWREGIAAARGGASADTMRPPTPDGHCTGHDHNAPQPGRSGKGCAAPTAVRAMGPPNRLDDPMPQFISLHHEDSAAVRRELAAGLCERPPRVSPKYLYDALGSRLFEAITELPEYTPTRAERSIVDTHLGDIAAAIGTGGTLVDLGAGNCAKAARLFDALQPRRYVAVDIAVDFLRDALLALEFRHPEVELVGLGMDFSAGLVLPTELGEGPFTVLYPGSSIGNFTPDEALAFLRSVRLACRGGGLLIGVDRVRDATSLQLAYDDPLQVTAAFNRNLLRRLNQLLGTDARLEDFRHLAVYDVQRSRIEMHLEALRDLTLSWPGGSCPMAAGERIHTENSCKYEPADFQALLEAAGFQDVQGWTDAQRSFSVFHARAAEG